MRATGWANVLAALVAKTGISPNGISVLGLAAGAAAGVALAMTSKVEDAAAVRGLWILGAGLVQLRLLSNLLDGMVAVLRDETSAVGELYNEVPDRLSDAAILIGLGYAAGGDPVLGFVAALVAIFVAYVRAMAKAVGATNDFCGPFAKPHRMALVTAFTLWVGVSPTSWRLEFGEARVALIILIAGGSLTAVRRLLRAAKELRRGS